MSEAMRFREKPKEIEARQFAGDADALMSVVTWIQNNDYVWFDMFTPAPPRGVSMDPTTGFLNLVNSKGQLSTAKKGDWIVKNLDGDFSVVSAEEFEATYQPIDDSVEVVVPIVPTPDPEPVPDPTPEPDPGVETPEEPIPDTPIVGETPDSTPAEEINDRYAR